ncbi:hypothetical protein NDU88_006591 [Pleurodeles waltl]|uniref:Uncharacterized protein n=1 Tax=Pleurodeles waltl TaxID=8319 RepID=A0AAV7VR14_PLEWA|nr:hypothetical protein NDU88_006591 [Pleurodeles waltl]
MKVVKVLNGAVQLEDGRVRNLQHSVCDGSDLADPHNNSTGAVASWVDPETSPGSTNPMGSRLSPREPGRSKGQVAELRWRTADERRRVGHQDTEDDP